MDKKTGPLFNEINGIGCDLLKSKNIDVTPFLIKSWTDLCKAYLVEANWFKEGYKPSFEEYIQNARISIGGHIVLLHLYCAYSDQISIHILESLSQHHQQIVQCSNTIFRLANDTAPSPNDMTNGDVKSIQCYIHETGASQEKAYVHVQQMISDNWDDMNYEARMAHTSLSLSPAFVEAALNLARTSQCIYQFGDGHGYRYKAKIIEHVQSLLVNPILLD